MDTPKKVLIVGLGKSGVSAARFFAKQGSEVTVTDIKTAEELKSAVDSLKEFKIRTSFGEHNLKLFEETNLIIPSPGVPLDQAVFKKAAKKKIPILGDIELASRHMNIPIIAISGTNGKTTTASLLHEMLKNGGKRSLLGGNIGKPVFDLIEESKNADLLILELSCFQLESCDTFQPAVSVLMNVTEDHLDRYPRFADYVKAKGRLFKNAKRDSFIVGNAGDRVCAKLLQKAKGKKCLFSSQKKIPGGLYSLDDTIQYRFGKTAEVYKVRNKHLHGIHNKENMMACVAVARYLGVSAEKVQFTLDSFLGLPHRNEFVREVNGVNYYNDSKATNPSATLMSLTGFPDKKVVLIIGGRSKKIPFKPLAKLIHKKVKHCYLIGEAASQIKRELGSAAKMTLAETLEKAVYLASHEAAWGEAVLLSPACSSLDQFRSFEQLGDAFKGQIMRL